MAVHSFRHPVIDFDRNNTYIQSEGCINQNFGVYDSSDELLWEHHQEITRLNASVYRNLGRHLMNAAIRNTQ